MVHSNDGGMKSELHASLLMTGGRGEQLRIWARWQHGWEGGGKKKKNVFMWGRRGFRRTQLKAKDMVVETMPTDEMTTETGLASKSLKAWTTDINSRNSGLRDSELSGALCPFSWKCVWALCFSSLVTNVGRCSTALCTMALLCTMQLAIAMRCCDINVLGWRGQVFARLHRLHTNMEIWGV